MAQDIFIFKVALMGKKSIWRKIAIEGDDTLDDLHEMIFAAFDRYDDHLYSFYFPAKQSKSIRVIVRNSVEYTSPDTFEFGGDDGQGDASETTLSSLRLKPKQKIYLPFRLWRRAVARNYGRGRGCAKGKRQVPANRGIQRRIPGAISGLRRG